MANATIKEIFNEFPSNSIDADDKIVFYSESTGVTRAVKASDILATSNNTSSFQWVSTATYAIDDPVIYNGQWWISLTNGNTGNIPTEGANWTAENKVSAIVVKPWSSGIIDTSNVIVSVGQEMYRLKTGVSIPFNSQTSPENDLTNWELFPYIDSEVRTGSEIGFDRPAQYGTDLVPITATTLTDTDLGAKKTIQKIYHQAASLAVPASWKKLITSEDYSSGEVNIIIVERERSDRKIYSITKDA